MEYTISETKLFDIVLKWLRNEYPNLRRDVLGDNIIFLDNETIILMFRKKTKELFVPRSNIRTVLINFFKLNENQVHKIIKIWVYRDYKLFTEKVTIL